MDVWPVDNWHACPGQFFFFFFFFQVQPYNRKYRSIGDHVWSMSLNILTELSVNSFNEKHNSAHAQSVIVMQF